nr:uncharacterized protein LOC113827757 [Penaeus vannamei]
MTTGHRNPKEPTPNRKKMSVTRVILVHLGVTLTLNLLCCAASPHHLVLHLVLVLVLGRGTPTLGDQQQHPGEVSRTGRLCQSSEVDAGGRGRPCRAPLQHHLAHPRGPAPPGALVQGRPA